CLFGHAPTSLLELERRRVHAITLAARGGAVIEDVAEVTATSTAGDFDAPHAVARVDLGVDAAVGDGAVEARPARPRVVFGLGAEQAIAARGAHVRRRDVPV